MLAMAHTPDAGMRDLEQELADSIRRRHDDEGNPLAGLFTLTRKMDSDLDDQFDVDCTILDFLAYKATDSVFEWRSSPQWSQSDLPSALVTMTSDWRDVLKHKYSGRCLSNQLAFRSRLLQFVLLFTHRLNHDKTWTSKGSLDEVDALNQRRGVFWQEQTSHSPALRDSFDSNSEFPLPADASSRNRNELASKLRMPEDRRRWVTDVEGTPSLHCLLALFIELTAARANLDDAWEFSKSWLHLAGQFMLQTVLEAYLRYGASGEEIFNTIFAFGCPGVAPDANEGTNISAMRRVFCDQTNAEEQIHGWAKIKRYYIKQLLPQDSSTTFVQAMESAQEQYPYVDFEAEVIAFLADLHDGVVKPDLVQVEQRRITINGTELSDDESREMIARMRLED